MNAPRRPDDELFAEALGRPAREREAFLLEACDGDAARVRDILSLLSAADDAGGFLDTAPRVDFAEPWVGASVGPFQIETLLASGGSGRVYRARRTGGDFEQTVAVKILARSLDDAEDSRRFRVECEALARLEHPNIARLLDAGSIDGLHPYLVMELVEGAPLHEYCDERNLSVPDRLALFRDVCEAVEYAHHNLVIHRDLKPANVLVSAEGRVKLLDFGIAKLVEEEAGDLTLTRQVRLTPRYASPEQLAGRAVNTLSDVYSLGVVLYELITGKRPYELSGTSSREWESALATTTVTLPSAALDDASSRTRGEALTALRRRVRGDLDNVLLRAMHRDPSQRYASPLALSDDIARYLEGRPVLARPDSWSYRTSKFVRRNAAMVAAVGLVAAALVGATLFSTASYLRMREAQEQSEAERRTAERTLGFLQSMLASADPEVGQGEGPVTVLDLLENGAGRIDSEFSAEPRVAARLHETVGTTFDHLGSLAAAEAPLRRSLELYEQEWGVAHPTSLRARARLADHLAGAGRREEALALLETGLAATETQPDSTRLPLLVSSVDLLAQRGDFEEAAQRGERAIAAARARDDDEDLLRALAAVGVAHTRLGRPAASIAALREAVDVSRRLHGETHSVTGSALQNLGYTLKMNGRGSEAVPLLEEALRIQSAVYDSTHTKVAIVRSNLGDVLGVAGRFDEAERHHRAAVAIFRENLGPSHSTTGHATNSLGSMFLVKGDYDAAVAPLREAARIYAENFGEEHPFVAAALHNLARAQRRGGDLDAALRTGQRVWAVREKTLPEDHPDVARSCEFMGRIMMDLQRPRDARPWFERGSNLRRELYEADNIMRIDADREFALCLWALGETELARTYLQTACEALLRARGEEDEKTRECVERLAALEAEGGRLSH